MGDEGEPSNRVDRQQEMAPFLAEQLAWIDHMIVTCQQASRITSGSWPSEPERSGRGDPDLRFVNLRSPSHCGLKTW